MVVVRVVSVETGAEVSRVELDDTGNVRFFGAADVLESNIRSWRIRNGGTDADAVHALARNGWSNGYLMAVAQ